MISVMAAMAHDAVTWRSALLEQGSLHAHTYGHLTLTDLVVALHILNHAARSMQGLHSASD